MIGDQRSDYNFYDNDCSFDELPPRILIRPIQSEKWFLCQRSGVFQSNFSKTVFRSSGVRHTFDILFCGFCIEKMPSKLEVALLHSKMSEWTGWLGDTPETVTTTKAPAVLTRESRIYLLFIKQRGLSYLIFVNFGTPLHCLGLLNY